MLYIVLRIFAENTFQEDVLSNNECFTGRRMRRVENKLQQILEEALAKEWETRWHSFYTLMWFIFPSKKFDYRRKTNM